MKEYDKKTVITAIQWMYGFTKKEAEKYYKNSSAEGRRLIADGFKQNAKRCLYDD